MKSLSESQIAKNKVYASKNGKKLDEHGRIIISENTKFFINASIQAKNSVVEQKPVRAEPTLREVLVSSFAKRVVSR
ncbi:hypothetical protein J4219_04870 [Candidatus Woesearchaeota archaeon]|nr:hypothetical protein [Candidatus Woesearchaeota archaeon]